MLSTTVESAVLEPEPDAAAAGAAAAGASIQASAPISEGSPRDDVHVEWSRRVHGTGFELTRRRAARVTAAVLRWQD